MVDKETDRCMGREARRKETKKKQTDRHRSEGEEFVLFCLLVAYRPSNMRVYLRDGSAQTILRAATLR